jgi:hypothetical protein
MDEGPKSNGGGAQGLDSRTSIQPAVPAVPRLSSFVRLLAGHLPALPGVRRLCHDASMQEER